MKEIFATEAVKTLKSEVDTIVEELREICVGVSVLNRVAFKWEEYKQYCYERLKEAFLVEQANYRATKFREEKKVH